MLLLLLLENWLIQKWTERNKININIYKDLTLNHLVRLEQLLGHGRLSTTNKDSRGILASSHDNETTRLFRANKRNPFLFCFCFYIIKIHHLIKNQSKHNFLRFFRQLVISSRFQWSHGVHPALPASSLNSFLPPLDQGNTLKKNNF